MKPNELDRLWEAAQRAGLRPVPGADMPGRNREVQRRQEVNQPA